MLNDAPAMRKAVASMLTKTFFTRDTATRGA